MNASPFASIDAELLLQARRRRRVLEHQPLVRIDITVRLLPAISEPSWKPHRISFSLPDRIDVADREIPGDTTPRSRPAPVVLKRDAPVRDRAELHGQAEENGARYCTPSLNAVVVAFEGGALEHTALAFKSRDLADLQIHFPGGHQRAHPPTRRGAARRKWPSRRCISVTRLAMGCRLSVQVQRGIAAAHDQQILVPELLHLADEQKQPRAFIGFDFRHRRRLFGWNEPPPAEITTTLHSNTVASVVTRKPDRRSSRSTLLLSR